MIIGQILNTRYQIDKDIEQGGMGTVCRGYNIALECELAIKAVTIEVYKPK